MRTSIPNGRILRVARWLVLLLAAQLLLFAWLFLGVYRDREHGDHYLFVKARPAVKVLFVAPLGEADPEDVRLTAEEQADESAYCEQVEALRGFERSVLLPF